MIRFSFSSATQQVVARLAIALLIVFPLIIIAPTTARADTILAQYTISQSDSGSSSLAPSAQDPSLTASDLTIVGATPVNISSCQCFLATN